MKSADFVYPQEHGNDDPPPLPVNEPSNPRYRFFRQAYFTAGDEEQFLTAWSAVQGRDGGSENAAITSTDVYESFSYLFHELKKGIFIRLVHQRLENFLPFSKADYSNSWAGKYFTWDTQRFPQLDDMFRFLSDQAGYAYKPSRIHTNRAEWYGNNGLIRYEHPISEGESGVNMLHDMFQTLVKEREVPDVDFFLNKRDFPLLPVDPRRHPYEAMYGDATDFPRLTSYGPGKVPVLGMTTTDDHRDIPIPTWEDWCRASYQHDGRLFPKPCRAYPDPPAMRWEDKIPVAVFRGASTGLSTSATRNPRIRFALQSLVHRSELDVGITRWNLRPRREHASEPFSIFEEAVMKQLPIVPTMDLVEQSMYKYILHLPGHSFAYRLSYELSSGSVILLYPSRYKMWYSHLLVPMVHYVPLGEDEDLVEKVRWCRENDDRMRTIATNARAFYDRYLSREGILDFLKETMWTLYRDVQGGNAVRYPPPGESQDAVQRRMIRDALQQESRRYPVSAAARDGEAWKRGAPRSNATEAEKMAWWRETEWMPWSWWSETILQDSEIVRRNKNTEIRSWRVPGEEGGTTYCLKIRYHASSAQPDPDLVHESMVYSVLQDAKLSGGFLTRYVLWHGEAEDQEDQGDQDNPEGVSILVTEFIHGRTMEQWIQSPWTDSASLLRSLVSVLGKIALLLDHAQDRCGFMHLDLYPWNIMIVPRITESTTTTRVPCWWTTSASGDTEATYVLVEETAPLWDVRLIDVGRSHVVWNGRSVHNVTPFTRDRMHDMMTLVWNTFHMLFKNHRLAHDGVHTIQSILRFFDPVLPPSLHHGRWRVTDMMQYLHHHKKFSATLHVSHNFPMPSGTTPLHFFQHLRALFPQLFKALRPSTMPTSTLPPSTINEWKIPPPSRAPVSRRHAPDEAPWTHAQTMIRQAHELLPSKLPFKPSSLFFPLRVFHLGQRPRMGEPFGLTPRTTD